MPVSRTEKRTFSESAGTRITLTVTSPRSVNLIALWIRLTSTWRRWSESPRTWSGRSGAMWTSKRRPLAPALGCSISCTFSTRRRSENSWLRMRTLPASIAEMSSTSSTRVSSVRAEVWITSAHSRCSPESRVVESSSDMPTMPLSGVRNSWLMLARKRLLAALARLASSVARVSALSSDIR